MVMGWYSVHIDARQGRTTRDRRQYRPEDFQCCHSPVREGSIEDGCIQRATTSTRLCTVLPMSVRPGACCSRMAFQAWCSVRSTSDSLQEKEDNVAGRDALRRN